MTVIIIGGGGREHAIAWKLKKDDDSVNIIAIPGNGGMSDIAECVSLDVQDIAKVADFSVERKVDYVIVGPEVPLSLGISEILGKKGMKVFGPCMKGAMLESSKIFAKQFMKKYNIPTAYFKVIGSYEEGLSIIKKKKYPCVLKYDGLAAGKGVIVAENSYDAMLFLKDIYINDIFGRENRKVLVEDYLEGKELSYLVFTDTENFVPMVPVKDHKRVFDGDKGPNTGGMGCYSPPFVFNDALEAKIKHSIVIPTMEGLTQENIDYRGVLYFGLMVTDKGPYLLEYNVRFGDPETQVILTRMGSPLLEVVDAVIDKKLSNIQIKWSSNKSLCVILTSAGYPGNYSKGKIIKGLDAVKDVVIFHAGTDRRNGNIITSGGRVLGITAVDTSIEKARQTVYKAASIIDFEGKHYRRDIGMN